MTDASAAAMAKSNMAKTLKSILNLRFLARSI